MSEMIDRVARAIEAKSSYVISEHHSKALARAAIEAMRVPTDAQYEALCATGKVWRELNSQTVWETYIDAAAKEIS
jgi:hypothetical protein